MSCTVLSSGPLPYGLTAALCRSTATADIYSSISSSKDAQDYATKARGALKARGRRESGGGADSRGGLTEEKCGGDGGSS